MSSNIQRGPWRELAQRPGFFSSNEGAHHGSSTATRARLISVCDNRPMVLQAVMLALTKCTEENDRRSYQKQMI